MRDDLLELILQPSSLRLSKSSGSGGRTRRSKLMRLSWALAHPHRCRELNREVAKARVELARQYWHDILSVACLPVPPLGCGFDVSSLSK